jgi:hypothetical protein
VFRNLYGGRILVPLDQVSDPGLKGLAVGDLGVGFKDLHLGVDGLGFGAFRMGGHQRSGGFEGRLPLAALGELLDFIEQPGPLLGQKGRFLLSDRLEEALGEFKVRMALAQVAGDLLGSIPGVRSEEFFDLGFGGGEFIGLDEAPGLIETICQAGQFLVLAEAVGQLGQDLVGQMKLSLVEMGVEDGGLGLTMPDHESGETFFALGVGEQRVVPYLSKKN